MKDPPTHTRKCEYPPHLQCLLVAEALGRRDDDVVVAELRGRHALLLAVEHLDAALSVDTGVGGGHSLLLA